jgi:hypothetical protein
LSQPDLESMRTPFRRFGFRAAIAAIAAIAAAGCTATQPVRVLPKGQSRFIASLGGPVLPKGAPTIVIPYATVGIARGVSDNTTVVADVHALMAAFGVAGVDIGAARRLRAEDAHGPEITALGQAYLFAGSGGARVFPHATINASWTRGSSQLVYVGADVVGQFTGKPAAFVSPLLGWQFPIRRSLAMQTELKWMAASADTRHGIFKAESSIGGRGALGLQFGFQWAR